MEVYKDCHRNNWIPQFTSTLCLSWLKGSRLNVLLSMHACILDFPFSLVTIITLTPTWCSIMIECPLPYTKRWGRGREKLPMHVALNNHNDETEVSMWLSVIIILDTVKRHIHGRSSVWFSIIIAMINMSTCKMS